MTEAVGFQPDTGPTLQPLGGNEVGMSDHVKIQLYSAPWCPDCTVAVRFLDGLGVDYEVVNIDEVEGAAERLEQETGKKGIPFLVVGDQWVRAYTPGGGAFPEEDIVRAIDGPRESSR